MFDGICEIQHAGVEPGGRTQLGLKDTAGAFNDWFLSAPGLEREILATALVAISTNKRVQCQIADPVQTWASVIRFLLVK